MGTRRFVWGLFSVCALLTGCGDAEKKVERAAQVSAPVIQGTFTLTAPKGMSVLAPALESSTTLYFGAFSQVARSAPVVAMNGTTETQPDVQLNDIWSRGATTLRDRTKIFGVVHTPSIAPNSITLPASQKDLSPVFDPVSSLSWSVTYPDTTPKTVQLDPPNKLTIDPGPFSTIQLNPVTLGGQGAELTLKSGTYYIGTLTLDSYSKVWLDQSNGPVIIYASTVNAFRGTFASLDGKPPNLFVGYLGTSALFLETQFNGAFVAPYAPITLRTVAGGHTGFFAAKAVTLDANAIVNYRPPNLIPVVAKVPQQTCRDLIQLRPDLTGAAQNEAYLNDLATYCGICDSKADFDLDGTADCLDGCPTDPAKIAPGLAGCGASDVQSDPDGIPDGLEVCDKDGRNLSPGDCGCVGQTNLKPLGTRCSDPQCPGQTNPVCDGQGRCGSSCLPCPDGIALSIRGYTYFVCGGNIPTGTGPITPKTHTNAFNTCAAKGLILARSDTSEQNQRIRTLLRSYNLTEAWLGGNQRTTVGNWRWSKVNSYDGDPFWSGAANGTPVNNSFAFWSANSPAGTGKCVAIQSADGRWAARDCAAALPYVCENAPQLPGPGEVGDGPGTGDLPLPEQPTPLNPALCVPEDGGAAPLPEPGHLDELINEYNLADAGVYTGAAKNPPPNGSTCAPSGQAENCPLTSLKEMPCDNPATPEHECDCAGENAVRRRTDPDVCEELFGAGYLCRVTKVNPDCVAIDAGDPSCETRAQCGKLDCSKTAPKYPNRCSDVTICPTGGETYTTPGLDDPTHTFTADTIVPDQFFDKPPSTTPSTVYADEPDPAHTGKDHVWCHLTPQDTGKVQPAGENMNKSGSSTATPIKLRFDPDLLFDAEPNPVAFGESKLHLDAHAFLVANVKLDGFLGQSFDKNIFDAGVGITADRCGISTSETHLMVLGSNIDISAYVPKIDSAATDLANSPLHAGAVLCQSRFNDFLLKADRLKKAFRDAQQLLLQYNALKSGNKTMPADLCWQLGIDKMVSNGFPLAGLCAAGERPEDTINRMIDFYQNGDVGEAARLVAATTSLNGASRVLRQAIATKLGVDGNGFDLHIPFADFKRSESKTIVKAPFAIGPVPMLLEIGIVASYGIHGAFDATLQFPSSLISDVGDLSNPNSPVTDKIAGVNATVEPWASAGITMFVGANFGIGSIGVEGAVTLARVSVPAAAGVGLAMATTVDTRDAPADIQSVSQLRSDGKPKLLFGNTTKAYQFYLTYQYGAAVVLSDILSGEVNGRLTIDFWLFSRTWRKRIVKFTGFPPHRFDLIAASGSAPVVTIGEGAVTRAAEGLFGMGRSEAQLPFTFLNFLTPPPVTTSVTDADVGSGGGGGTGGAGAGTGGLGEPTLGTLSKAKTEQFSYDTLCCQKQGETCSLMGSPSCCDPLQCAGATEEKSGTCQPKPDLACAAPTTLCGYRDDLGVTVLCCSGDPCPKNGICPSACVGPGEACSPDGQASLTPHCCADNEVSCECKADQTGPNCARTCQTHPN
jgi:hypothetical protein